MNSVVLFCTVMYIVGLTLMLRGGLQLTGVAPPSLASRGKGASSGGGSMVLVVGAVLGAAVLLLNLLLVACCLHRRANKRITGGFD